MTTKAELKSAHLQDLIRRRGRVLAVLHPQRELEAEARNFDLYHWQLVVTAMTAGAAFGVCHPESRH
jgi:hypothetical protein